MRRSGRARVGLAVGTFIALAPWVAHAFQWSGRLGLAYDRVETWAGPNYSLVPRLRLDGFAAASGSIVAPGVVDWSGRLGYESDRSTYTTAAGDTDLEANALTYALRLGVLQARSARAGVSGSVSRWRSDYSSDLAVGKATGTTIADEYAVSAFTGPRGAPPVSATFNYRDTVNSGLGRAATRETWKTLDVATQMGQPSLNSELSYNAQWVSGTLEANNFASQYLTLRGTADPAQGVRGAISASYFIREPTALGTTNPRLEDTRVDGSVDWGGFGRGTGGRISYRYSHATATDPSLQLREVLSHSAAALFGRPISAEWRWLGSASASFSERRVGAVADSSDATQAVGLTLDFTRPTVSASLGARVGLTEPSSGSTALAYGASALFNKSWRRPRHSFSVSYAASYDSNLSPSGGWNLTQSLFAELQPTALGPMTYSAYLRASGARSGGGIFGAGASRSIATGGSIQYRRYFMSLEVGAVDAASGALANPISDSLLVPAGYNTHSRFALWTLAVPLAERLSLRALAKYTILSGPATPEQREALLNPSLVYAIGSWAFSIEDRYTAGGTTAFDHRVNELFVRASRTFGGP